MRKVQKTARKHGRHSRVLSGLVSRSETGLKKLLPILLALIWFCAGSLFGNVVGNRDIPVARSALLELGMLCRGDYVDVTVRADQVSANCGNGEPVIVQNFLDR